MSGSFIKKITNIKKLFIRFFLLFVFTIIIVFVGLKINTAKAADPWYNISWNYRTKITIDHTKVASSTLNYFPVLISTTTVALKYSGFSGGHVGKNNGGDILFTSADGTTALNYEIERYASSTGELIAWVKIPTLATSTDTNIYMYYGNSAAPTPAASVAQGVWDDGGSNYYKGVWHMPDGTTLTPNDSTQYGHNGSLSSTAKPSASTGTIGGGASFPGGEGSNTSQISVPYSADFVPGSGDFTVSTIFKASSFNIGFYNELVGVTQLGQPRSWTLDIAGNSAARVYRDVSGSDSPLSFPYAFNVGQTYWLTATRSGNTWTMYVNGTPLTPQTNSSNPDNATMPLVMGTFGDYSGNDHKFHGVLDETRFTKGLARSADWIKTEYNNQNSPSTFSSFASEEIISPPDAPTSLSATSGNAQVSLSWNAPVNSGYSSVVDYVIDYKLTSDSVWSTFADGVSTNTTFTVNGLTNGSSYDFRVSAVNSVLQGLPSTLVTSIPLAAPTAPIIGTAVAGNAQATVTFSGVATSSPAWYNNNWSYRKKITIDHNKVQNSDQSNFPVLVSLSGLSNVNLKGTDVRFTSSDGTTELARDVEKYSSGSLISWVKIPTLSSSADTVIYMYYGNPTAAEPSPSGTYGSQKVWDDGGSNYFKGVWHLPNGTVLSPNDSTSNAINGTNGSTVSVASGKIDGGASFSGDSNSYVGLGAYNPLPSGVGTVSIWVNWNSSSLNINNYALAQGNDDPSSSGISVWGLDVLPNPNNLQATVSLLYGSPSVGARWVSANVSANTGTWHLLTAVMKPNAQELYFDGVLVQNGTLSTVTPSPSAGMFIGKTSRSNPYSYAFNGLLDEARVSATSRSADWIKTEFNNQNAPSSFVTVAGQESVNIPDGGSPVVSYTVTSLPSGIIATGSSSPIVVNGLTNGTSYTFTVTATNAVGASASSSPSNSVTPATLPGPPTALSAAGGNTQVSLSWSPPAYNGGLAINDYVIEFKLSSTSTWTVFADASSTATTTTVINLTNGLPYNFRVSAVNAVGQGTASAAATSTPSSPPGPPTGVTGVRGNASVLVSFIAPIFDGGGTITSYRITSNPGNISTTTNTTSGIVTGLANGTTYTFTVAATNGAGTGSSSVDSSPVTPATVPDAPTSAVASSSNTQVSVSFTPPVSNGGSAITGYTVTSAPGGFTGTGSASPIIVAGLTNGTSYTFTVTATNDVGTSTGSVSTIAVTPMTMPDAPIVGTSTAGNSEALVAFTPPVSNGGSVITSYTVTSHPGNFISSSSTSPILVTGLTNGTQYNFTVTATNQVGISSASSASNNVTPITIPNSPTSLTPTAGNTQVALSWTAPIINGGSAIIDYVIEYKLSASSTWSVSSDPSSANTSGTVIGLINGLPYDFRVEAVNLAGQGEASSEVSATPVGQPDAPTIGNVTPLNAQVSVSFTPLVSNGGSAITGYTVTSAPGGFTGTGSASPIIVAGLTNGTSYTFTVTATNAIGTGSSSSPSASTTPVTVPNAPTLVSAVEGNTQAIVSFSPPAFDGGTPITNYTVTSAPGGFTATGSTSPITVTGLTNGTTYNFTVTATNAIGTGADSAPSNNVKLSTEPDKPVNLAAVVLGSSISLTWSAPENNGGTAVTDYVVEYQLSTGGTWSVFSDASSTQTSATVIGLSNRTSYDFRVRAINVIGQSIPSDIVTASPGEPAQVFIQNISDLTNPSIGTNIRITNEGTSEYEYQYTWCITDSIDNLCGGGDDVFSGSNAKLIQAHENYDFNATSTVPNPGNYFFHINVLYGSQSSSAYQSFTAVATFPDAPTAVTATSSDSQAVVSFTPPVSNGGSAITGYTVTSAPGGFTGTGSTSPITVAGLTNGMAYTFTMTATNIVGIGPVSSPPSNSVTPMSIPNAPTGLLATAGNGQVSLSWTAPVNNGGSAITDYVVEYKLSSDSVWSVVADTYSNGTTAVITGLTNGSSYDFRVSAVNSIGQSSVNGTSANPARPAIDTPPTQSGNTGSVGSGSISSGGSYLYQQTQQSLTSISTSTNTTATAKTNNSNNFNNSNNSANNSKTNEGTKGSAGGNTSLETNGQSNSNQASATPAEKPTDAISSIGAKSANLPENLPSNGGAGRGAESGSGIPWSTVVATSILTFILGGGIAFFILRRRFLMI